jgi:hypothetical protein
MKDPSTNEGDAVGDDRVETEEYDVELGPSPERIRDRCAPILCALTDILHLIGQWVKEQQRFHNITVGLYGDRDNVSFTEWAQAATTQTLADARQQSTSCTLVSSASAATRSMSASAVPVAWVAALWPVSSVASSVPHGQSSPCSAPPRPRLTVAKEPLQEFAVALAAVVRRKDKAFFNEFKFLSLLTTTLEGPRQRLNVAHDDAASIAKN